LLKYILLKYQGEPDDDEPDVHITSAEELKKMTKEINSSDSPDENLLNLQRSSTTINQQIESFSTQLIEPVKSLGLPRTFLSFSYYLYNIFFYYNIFILKKKQFFKKL